jgi:transposase
MEKARRCFVGVDVSKEKLDVHIHGERESFVVGNDDDGIAHLVLVLRLRAVVRVVFESTGRFGRSLAASLAAAGIECHCVPPQRIRMFAKALGVEAKTDRIDAKVIALYAATAPLVARPAPSPTVEHLKDLVVRRQQLVGMQTQELNHRASLPAALQESSDSLLNVLRLAIKDSERAIEAAIRADNDLRRRAAAIRTLKGVGPFLCATLLAFLPELGACSSKQAAALVGLAPFDDESGGRERSRHIRGGRRRLRIVLYMAARNSVRFEPLIKPIYRRLKEAGRPDKVALSAALRKLVVIINARVRDALKAPQTAETA